MTVVARRNLPAGAALIVGDAEQLPLLSDRFDVILTSSSFHFWPHPREALRELRRILRKSGRLVVTDWCDDFIACRLCHAFLRWRHGTQHRVLTTTECNALLQDAGFRVTSIETYRVSWLWGLMTAVAEQ